MPDLNIWYGPDSYMGANIAELLHQMTKMTDEEIVEVHPEHNRDSIKSILPRLHYYQVLVTNSLFCSNFFFFLLFPNYCSIAAFVVSVLLVSRNDRCLRRSSHSFLHFFFPGKFL